MQEQLEFSRHVNNVSWNKACLKLNDTEKGQNCKRKEFKIFKYIAALDWLQIESK